jgi:hypothetical protein
MILLALVACGDDQPVRHDAAIDAFRYLDSGSDGPQCGATGGCANGPACGSACCGSGESCVNGACMCGSGSGCTGGDTCNGAGPFAPGFCGEICCGVTVGCPI